MTTDLFELTDDQIVSELLNALPTVDSDALDVLVPAVRKLLDRPRPGYTYRAVVVRWVDADTVLLDIDLGLRQWTHDEPIRLNRVNAPDRKPAKGLATEWMRDAAPEGTELVIRTHLDEEDRYGRLLGDLYLLADDSGRYLDLNAALVDAGHAQWYAGGTRPADY